MGSRKGTEVGLGFFQACWWLWQGCGAAQSPDPIPSSIQAVVGYEGRRMWPLVMLSSKLEALLGAPWEGILVLPTAPCAFPRLKSHIRLCCPALLRPFAKHPELGAAWRGEHREKSSKLLARAARSAPCSLTLQLLPGPMGCTSSASFLGKQLPALPNVQLSEQAELHPNPSCTSCFC